MNKCTCNKEFNTINELRGHYGHCKTHRNRFDSILTYDFLYENLIVNNFSANYIAINILNNIEGISAGKIIKEAKKFDIHTKSMKESANLKSTREKYSNTCLKLFGDTNSFGKKSLIYKKRNETVKKKYGVDNVFQLDSVKKKSVETMIKKYGVSHTIFFPDRHSNVGLRSRPHKEIEKCLKELNVNFVSDKIIPEFRKFNTELNRYFCPRPDICITDKKIIIEINSNLYHANPLKYKKDDMIHRWQGDMRAEDIWKYDAIRKRHLQSFGYKVVVLWEHAMRKHNKDLKLMLSKILRLTHKENNNDM